MKDFKEKVDELNESRISLDDHIWGIFYRYIKEKGINFSGPRTWEQDSDGDIRFDGEDGCMGCYDPTTLYIEEKYFIDPEKSFADDKEKVRLEMVAREKAKESKEYALYLELQKKFK